MNKPSLTNFVKSTQAAASKHSPEILTGLGIAGMISTTVLAVRATPKALHMIEERKKLEQVDALSPIETVKTAWKPYIPAVITCGVSVACLIGASSVSVKRTAALATAYQISETALRDYKEKVIETIGEKKEKDIRNKVAEKHVRENPVTNNEIIITGKGKTLFYDNISGRYFESDIDLIKKVENVLNRRLLMDMYVSLNEFYTEVGLDGVAAGYELGWNMDGGYLEFEFSPCMSNDGRACLALEYNIQPKSGYSKLA